MTNEEEVEYCSGCDEEIDNCNCEDNQCGECGESYDTCICFDDDEEDNDDVGSIYIVDVTDSNENMIHFENFEKAIKHCNDTFGFSGEDWENVANSYNFDELEAYLDLEGIFCY